MSTAGASPFSGGQAMNRRGKSLSGRAVDELDDDTSQRLHRVETSAFLGFCQEIAIAKQADVNDDAGGARPRLLEDYYVLGQQIGAGAFGVVREAVSLDSGITYCCKSIPKASLTSEMFLDIRQEAEVMVHLKGHPHIVEFMGMFQDDTHVHIVQELCKGGDLYSKLTKTPMPYTEKQAAAITRTVLMVLEHCHAMGVLYRDVKPDNFLLTTDDEHAVLKAADFGVSRFIKPGDKLEDFCGTPTYMAPEVFDCSYSFPADVWSAGVMLYWVLCGDFPFKGRNKLELARRVVSEHVKLEGGVWDQISADAKDCLKAMLRKDPATRPTASALLQHKWFKAMSCAPSKPLGSVMLQRMRVFAAMNPFKQEALRVVTRHFLEPAFLVGLRSMFDAMDTDGDGRLTRREVGQALAGQGAQVDPVELQALLVHVDDDQDGVIDFTEFAASTISASLLERRELLQAVFDWFDKDGDGVISRAEVEAALAHRLNPPQLPQPSQPSQPSQMSLAQQGSVVGACSPQLVGLPQADPVQRQPSALAPHTSPPSPTPHALPASPSKTSQSDKRLAKLLVQLDRNLQGKMWFEDFSLMLLESEETGREGFKLKWRVKKPTPDRVFADRKSLTSLPNLQPLSRAGSPSGTLKVAPTTSFSRRRSSVGGVSDKPPSVQLSGLSFGATFRMRRGSLQVLQAGSSSCAGIEGEDSRDAGAKSLSRTFLESHNSGISAFFSKLTGFRSSSQVGTPQRQGSASQTPAPTLPDAAAGVEPAVVSPCLCSTTDIQAALAQGDAGRDSSPRQSCLRRSTLQSTLGTACSTEQAGADARGSLAKGARKGPRHISWGVSSDAGAEPGSDGGGKAPAPRTGPQDSPVRAGHSGDLPASLLAVSEASPAVAAQGPHALPAALVRRSGLGRADSPLRPSTSQLSSSQLELTASNAAQGGCGAAMSVGPGSDFSLPAHRGGSSSLLCDTIPSTLQSPSKAQLAGAMHRAPSFTEGKPGAAGRAAQVSQVAQVAQVAQPHGGAASCAAALQAVVRGSLACFCGAPARDMSPLRR